MMVLVALIVLILCMIIGVSIPLAFLASAIFLVFVGDMPTASLVPFGYSKMNSVLLLTIPLFILAGSIMDKGGIGKKLIGSIEIFVGRLRGGLGVVTVLACAIFGAISGSSSATLSCIGSIMSPRLKENGYDEGFIGALIASSSVLGILIPPSMLMILFAWVGGQSVLASFLATLIPGIMLVILFSCINLYYAKNNPNIKVSSAIIKNSQLHEKTKERGPLAAILMPVIILGSIYGGILTPTEAAAVSVIYAVPVGFLVYRSLNLASFKEALIEAGKTTGVIMIMLFAVMILSRLYIMNNVPNLILELLTSISENKYVILLMVNMFMVIIGMLMDDCSGILLCTPILLPVMNEIGVHPIHFAAIIGVNLGMGNITPPTAPLLYLAGRISQAEVAHMLKPTLTLILFAWIPTLIITTYLPEVALFLPKALGFL